MEKASVGFVLASQRSMAIRAGSMAVFKSYQSPRAGLFKRVWVGYCLIGARINFPLIHLRLTCIIAALIHINNTNTVQRQG